MMNQNKGITLVALVITIIVLLILAGAAYGIIQGSDNVFAKAIEAKETWNNDVNYENNVLVEQVENVLAYEWE